MSATLVIARGLGGQPLRRVVLGRGNGLVYLANPESIGSLAVSVPESIGFPERDVFQFDPAVLAELSREWAKQRLTASETWARLSLYR